MGNSVHSNRPRQRVAAVLRGLGLTLACTTAACASKSDGSAEVKPNSAAQLAECAEVATLYPQGRRGDAALLRSLVDRQWSRRDGGVGSIHGPPMKWRRSTDLKFVPLPGKVQVSLEETSEATEEDPAKVSWTKDCQVCGDVMICGSDEAFTLGVREFERDKSVVRVLDVDPVIELSPTELYMIRYEHEVLLTFGDDPRSVDKGTLSIAVRRLTKDAPVTRQAANYEVEGARGVKVELPGNLGGLRIKFRDQGRAPDAGGSGRSKTLRRSLFDYETLKTHPKMMSQPSSLELTDKEKEGFNFPY